MRVLHLVASLDIGGLENIVVSLCAESAREGSNHATLGVINDVFNRRLVAVLRESGATVMLHRRRRGSMTDTLKLLSDLWRDMSKKRYDIIHVHQGLPALVASLLSLGFPMPVVYTLHCMKPSVLTAGERLCAKVAARRVTRFVAISKAVRDSYPEFTTRGAIDVIPNGIDLVRFRQNRNFGDVPRLICVAGLRHQIKGQDVLLKALAILKNRGEKFTCLLVGEGVSRPFLEQMVGDLGLADRVELLGARFDVPQLLAESDLCILPSRSEGFGMAIIEAMASGVPVVASDIDGLREIIRHGWNGYLFESGNERDLAGKVAELLDAPSIRNRLSLNGYNDARHYSIEQTYRSYVALYQQLVTNSR